LAFLHHRSCRICYAVFLAAMELLFLPQRRIGQSAVGGGQRSSMRSMQQPMVVQDLQVLANCHLRGFELPGQVAHQNPPVTIQRLQDGPSSFLVKHTRVPKPAARTFRAGFSFYCFL
jgi:hypothetical protein